MVARSTARVILADKAFTWSLRHVFFDMFNLPTDSTRLQFADLRAV